MMEQICLRNPAKMEFLQGNNWTENFPEDVKVEVSDNGEVFVTAENTGLLKIRFSYNAPKELQQAYVYGDAWERGYGDLCWSRQKRIMPWYCIFTDQKTTCGYGVKVQPNALCYWEYTGGSLRVTFDIRNGSDELFLHGKKLLAAVLVSGKYEGNVMKAAHAFCRLMCDEPRKPKYPVFGGNDWYCNYGKSSEQRILTHAGRIAECAPEGENRPYMVVDDGWQMSEVGKEGSCSGGPWEPNENFSDMGALAKSMTEAGVLPGIWVRPLLVETEVPEKYILKKIGTSNVLDPSHEDVLAWVQNDMKKLVNWGYRLIKHDFSTYDIFGAWGFEMTEDLFGEKIEFSDKTRTTAQIIKDLYRAIREAAGEDTVIIGCNTMSHLSAGIFELQRTGDDTSGLEWWKTRKMGVNTLAMRMIQHNAFYQADADCVGITGKIPWETNRRWLDVLAKSGTPLFVSIAEDAYSEEVKKDLKKAFKKAAAAHEPSEPLDFVENLTPAKWRSDFGAEEYDWE